LAEALPYHVSLQFVISLSLVNFMSQPGETGF